METDSPDHLPQAKLVSPKGARFSVIWIIPILAAVVAIGIAVQRILSEGPTITIVFSSAEGVEANKTFIKYKDVNIGQVTAVRLTNDFSKVAVTAQIEKHAAGLMVEDAKFWVVRPQITLSGISGLSTLLSGNYIGFEAGKSERRQTTFVGLDEVPVVAGESGRQFTLIAPELGSLSVGSPIYYRRLPVGQVAGYSLTADGSEVQIQIFINAPYDRYVYRSTRFWNASGIDVSLTAEGVSVRTESLVALLVGGLAFDLPPFATREPAEATNAPFTLYADRLAAMKAPDPVARHFVLYFKESLRGLSVGAPVTLLGLNIGEVTSVGLQIDPDKAEVKPRVTITFYPERILSYVDDKSKKLVESMMPTDPQRRYTLLRRQIEERGLRGQLKSASLITGQLYVAFDYHPGAPKLKLDLDQPTPVLPTVPSDLANLEAKLGSIVDKIDRMPLEAIGNDLKKDLESLDQTLMSVRKLVMNADTELVPGLKRDIDTLHQTLETAERAIANANTSLLESNAPVQQDLRDALSEFARAARSLRVLLNELERQPSSVIRGKVESMGGAK